MHNDTPSPTHPGQEIGRVLRGKKVDAVIIDELPIPKFMVIDEPHRPREDPMDLIHKIHALPPGFLKEKIQRAADEVRSMTIPGRWQPPFHNSPKKNEEP